MSHSQERYTPRSLGLRFLGQSSLWDITLHAEGSAVAPVDLAIATGAVETAWWGLVTGGAEGGGGLNGGQEHDRSSGDEEWAENLVGKHGDWSVMRFKKWWGKNQYLNASSRNDSFQSR